ncbi:MAG TPA: glycerol kinase GlpK [Anaerolineales bacterium]|nr:glycerol kinase GlpK [Anaerolineales bacterium]
MAGFIASIDQGTTSTRCIIFNHEGQIISVSQREHRQIYPRPGWVEHDPIEIWQNVKLVMEDSLSKSNLTKADILGIGITNQRETTVIWDRSTGLPVYNAIVWQDTRTDIICAELSKNGGQDRFRNATGLPLATYFSGPKIQWLLNQISNGHDRAIKGELLFGNMDTWLIWNLTGEHITDVTNASRTMLMNLKTLAWDSNILQELSIPEILLPKIRSSSEVYGLSKEVFSGTPVCGDLGDQQAALFGQTCFNQGEAKNTYGTGCFMLLNTGSKPVHSKNGLLTTLGYKIGSQPAAYCLEGSIAITGALVQWLRDNLGIIQNSGEIETLARSVEDSGGIYFVPAFSGLFAPYWRSDARGLIIGLTRYINKSHIARAALEATAYQTREVLEAMNADSGVALTSLKVDGGMVANELLMQFQADILNVPVIRPAVAETTALGAAYAAGLAVGYWSNQDQLRANWTWEREWIPKMDSDRREKLYTGWKKAVTRTFDWIE